MIEKFERTGSVLDDSESKTGRPVTVTTPETVETVRELYQEEPTTSVRRASAQLGISYGSLHTILT